MNICCFKQCEELFLLGSLFNDLFFSMSACYKLVYVMKVCQPSACDLMKRFVQAAITRFPQSAYSIKHSVNRQDFCLLVFTLLLSLQRSRISLSMLYQLQENQLS